MDNIIAMKKYAINYNRSFPDHRTTYDFELYQRLKANPVTYFRAWVTGFNVNFSRYFAIHGCTAMLIVVGCFAIYKAHGITNDQVLANRSTRDSFKWIYHSQRPQSGRYDTVLSKFENVNGGVYDWAFE